MKQFSLGVGLCILAFLVWRFAMSLSSDALGMAVGVVFGILAGIPTALLVLASQRRREPDKDDSAPDGAVYIVYNTHTDNRQLTITPQTAGGMPLLADRQRELAAARERRFVVIGEREEWEG